MLIHMEVKTPPELAIAKCAKLLTPSYRLTVYRFGFVLKVVNFMFNYFIFSVIIFKPYQ